MCRNMHIMARLALPLLLSALALLSGCGGGGSAVNSGTISGTAVKGPVGGGTVKAYAITDGAMGGQLSSATTDTQGNYHLPIGTYSGVLMLQLSGGEFMDEASGVMKSMSPGDVMTCVIPAVTSGQAMTNIQITPLTSMAQAMAGNMAGGMTATNIAAAHASVGSYFMVNDILHTSPMNPLLPGAGGSATPAMENYGMVIAAMSQSAMDLGMSSSSSMVTAMMNDASDGIMNGKMGNTQIMMGGMMAGNTMMNSTAGTSGLALEMAAFINSAMNKSGVSAQDMQALMSQLTDSSTDPLQAGGGTPINGMVSGTVFNGAMSNATVMAYAVSGGTMGAQLASGTTGTMGNFSLSLGAYSGPVMLKMLGGSYHDLATGAFMTLMDGDVMTAVMPTIASGAMVTGIHMTPLTSMAQARATGMAGGMIDANIATANTAVGNYFMISDILHTVPMNPAVPGSGSGATLAMMNYGVTLAAMSQYAYTLGMTDPAALIPVMMQDAFDGIMNGKMGGTSITMAGMGGGMMGGGGTMMQPTVGTSGLATAMATFMGSSVNKSGLTAGDVQSLMNHLSTSNGTLQ